MSRGPDIGTMLVRALYRDSVARKCPVEIMSSDWVRWASATFVGARHEMTWTGAPSPALDAWIEELPEAEFDLRGHLLADLKILAVSRTATSVGIEVEALTVEA
jgi:hypothetical protein